jgi:arabinose-5-phosphate isomerase
MSPHLSRTLPPTSTGRSPREVAAEVLRTEAAAVEGLISQLDERFDRAVDLLRACPGRVVCTGMGKSGLVLQKIAATLASTGTPAFFLHPAEAVHGDLGMIVPGDVVLAASYSGTTEELLRLVESLKRLGVPLVVMTANAASPLARHADLHLPVAIDREACPLDLAPTASTTATLALGDALAMALLEARGFTREDFALLHPAGRLGKRLLKVEQLMHSGEALPAVRTGTPMRDIS